MRASKSGSRRAKVEAAPRIGAAADHPPRAGVRIAGALFLAAGLAWLVAREMHFATWVDDDAFISFRYARNLAEGNGLVFNTGERVEGYSNFLWTVVMAGCHKLGFDLPSAARMLGAVFSILTPLMLFFFTRTKLFASASGAWRGSAAETNNVEPVPIAVALLGPLLVCCSDNWAAWAVGGLENVLSGFLVALAFLLYFTATGVTSGTATGVTSETATDAARTRRLAMCAFVLCLAGMNHPTNNLFMGIIGLDLCCSVLAGRSGRRDLVVFAVVVLVVFGPYTGWRVATYGDLLPNTYYAKVGLTTATLQRGALYLGEILRAFPLAFIGLGLASAMLLRQRERNESLALLVVGAWLPIVYVLLVGGEEFPAYRSLIVLVPLMAVILQAVVYRVLLRTGAVVPGTGLGRRALPSAVAAAVLVGHALPLYGNHRVRLLDDAVRLGRTGLSVAAALMLRDHLKPDTLFAHSGAGLIAYYTNFRWIDTLGLTDHHIARTTVKDLGKFAAGHEKGDGAYVWSRQPDYVMFPGYPISDPKPGSKGDRELFAIPEFHRVYRPIRLVFQFKGPSDDVPREHSLYLYERIGPKSAR